MYSHTKKSRSKYRKSCKRSSPKKSRKPCKSDEYRNRSTGRCRKKSRKPCKSDQYRNRSTGRCRKKSKNHANQQTNIVTALQVDVERKHLQQERLLKHIRIFHQRVG